MVNTSVCILGDRLLSGRCPHVPPLPSGPAGSYHSPAGACSCRPSCFSSCVCVQITHCQLIAANSDMGGGSAICLICFDLTFKTGSCHFLLLIMSILHGGNYHIHHMASFVAHTPTCIGVLSTSWASVDLMHYF